MARNILKLGALEAQKTAFLLCDIQETFRPHVKHFGEVVKVANKMVAAAKVFNIPVYVSEQYPKGLGHTTKDINISDAALVYEKTKFSMYTPELQEKLKKDVPNLSSVILFGIEAHVCIEQTVIDLLNEDINVHVLADGVSSRSLMDRGLALQRMQSLGCFITTSENVLFKLLRDKNHPAFKDISKLNKVPTVDILGYVTSKL
ncbi:PREDICTED: isochorismatase domain-containing protein 1-like isoform X1 [Papilio xuthus]|uniref:Isochorismatase domain-containing protein 1 n=1 Tax=Papilio xuthus TaxID=66420 RepID=A0AAJ7EGZ3_PAPXU|nr:PREDICTED: isochorismatase domain-containing protein 1-like isoform X1 [Papilio xuthus]XP_013177027.1 PREDICTED: isochorismatase domain-containing protein 1-like isoform X1 [Papilio xuthus]